MFNWMPNVLLTIHPTDCFIDLFLFDNCNPVQGGGSVWWWWRHGTEALCIGPRTFKQRYDGLWVAQLDLYGLLGVSLFSSFTNMRNASSCGSLRVNRQAGLKSSDLDSTFYRLIWISSCTDSIIEVLFQSKKSESLCRRCLSNYFRCSAKRSQIRVIDCR